MKHCRSCNQGFEPRNSMAVACSPRCALKLVKAKKKAEAEDTLKRRMALLSRRDWMDLAQKAVNEYVRWRDRGKPCICCGTPWDETFQAGHYLTRGARPELRFDLDNIHGQSVRCNLHLHGNQAAYRKGLIERIGVERVERLEGPHPLPKWSQDELKTMRDAFRRHTKLLKEQA